MRFIRKDTNLYRKKARGLHLVQTWYRPQEGVRKKKRAALVGITQKQEQLLQIRTSQA